MWECGNGRQEGSEQCDDGNGVAGDGCSGFCTLEDVEPGIEPTLASIQRFVFTPICSVCHWPAGTGQFMHLHTEDASYENLVLIDYSFLCSGRRVEPGNPDASCLVLKLEGSSQAGGERMPSGGAPPLTAEQIGAIRQWILDGAPR
jgi:cysteine-rich repeat protein